MNRSTIHGQRRKSESIHVVIMEHDIDDPLLSSGAIMMEQYTSNSEEQVRDRAQSLVNGGKYGRVWVGRIDTDMLAEIDRNNLPEPPSLTLLRVAMCPDKECGGLGYTVRQVSDNEAEQVQCQWCAEKDALVGEADSELPF